MKQNPFIYHIASKEAWKNQIQDGCYNPPSLSSEGFIHCSPFDEILETARVWFSGQDNLIVLGIDPDKIPGKVRYELAPGRSSLMPHIYGPLPVDAVSQILSLSQGPDGKFILHENPANPV